MAAERDLDLLDDYLANRLNANERAAFEQKLISDPELQSEFNVQQQLIGGIQKARMAELKSMMNSIPVSTLHGGSAMAGKIALWVSVVAIIGVGSYFLLNDKSEPNLTTSPAAEQQKPEVAPDQNESTQAEVQEQEDPMKPHEDSPVVSDKQGATEQKPIGAPKPIRRKPGETSQADPQIKVYDPTEGEDNNSSTVPTDGANLPSEARESEIAVEIALDKKYNFHYQFKGGKLFLYGPFQKNLYEILEFFGDEKRTIFLYYDNQYFLLKDNNERIKELVAVQNAELIKKLNEHRN
jgi:hypothetical protein